MALMSRRNIVIAAASAVIVIGAAAWFLMDGGDVAAPDDPPARSAVPLYQNLGTIVVNLVNSDEETHYMQLDVSLMTRSTKCAKALEFYVPIFRNALLELFSRQDYQSMLLPAEREQLRSDARDTVLKVAAKKMKQPHVEDVLFTSLVIQ